MVINSIIMKYKLSEVGNGWEYLPEHERKLKSNYEKLYNDIIRNEKNIKSFKEKIKNSLNELKKWKREIPALYVELTKLKREIVPTISITYSKTPKIKKFDKNEIKTTGNQSWSISMRIKGQPKSIYIGTTKEVCWKLDEIDGIMRWDIGGYKTFLLNKRINQEIAIKKRIKELITPHIIKELVEIRDRTGDVQEFIDRKKINGLNYLKLIVDN